MWVHVSHWDIFKYSFTFRFFSFYWKMGVEHFQSMKSDYATRRNWSSLIFGSCKNYFSLFVVWNWKKNWKGGEKVAIVDVDLSSIYCSHICCLCQDNRVKFKKNVFLPFPESRNTRTWRKEFGAEKKLYYSPPSKSFAFILTVEKMWILKVFQRTYQLQ